MTTPPDNNASGAALSDTDRRIHDIETRYETRIRTLEEENTRLAADLETRFQELGTLTRIMQAKEARLAEIQAQAARRESELDARAAHLQDRLDTVLASTSWRITRPLRRIMALLGRGRP